jgi:hypothetical protein
MSSAARLPVLVFQMSGDQPKQDMNEEQSATRSAPVYERPVVKRLGILSELTQGGGSSSHADGVNFS